MDVRQRLAGQIADREEQVTDRLGDPGHASVCVRCGEGAARGAHGGEAVLTGGREVAAEVEERERVGVARENFRGSGVAEKLADERHEPADEGAVGIGAEMAAAVAERANEPDLGDAAAHAVFVGAVGGGQRRNAAGLVNDGGEAFLGVLDQAVVVDDLLLLRGEGHGEWSDAESGA